MHFDNESFYKPDDPQLRILGAVQTLARWRCEKIGPSYIKIGNRILYKGADLNKFLDQNYAM